MSLPSAAIDPDVAVSSPPITIRRDDLPDPLGPTNPSVSPCGTVSEISCKISILPALPESESDTSVSERASVMGVAFDRVGSVSYGVLRRAHNIGLGLILTMGAIVGTAAAETVTIAALGDSLTQGYGLTADNGFVPQLEAWLQDQGADVRVMNAGVSGDTTAGGLSRVAWTLTPDVDAMIVNLGGNDLLRGIDPAVSRENLHGILSAAQDAEVDVLLVGLDAPGNYGPAFEAAFDAMYPELAEEFGVIYYPDFFAPLLAVADQEGARQRYMQPDNPAPEALRALR
ncbi:Esterase TesA [Nymphon striatum]|nr:Esterase TesA [Nymphon striatum]